MCPRTVRLYGIALTVLVALTCSVASPAPQKSSKELIAGNLTLMIADNVRREGNNSPGFGPLPKGTARFDADGRYSLEVMPITGSQPGISASGTYTLDEASKSLTLKVEESSASNWRGTTQERHVEVRLKRLLGMGDFSAAGCLS